MNLTVEQRVQNGIDWLESHGVANWREVIDLKRFDMSDTCKCVLGFCFGAGRMQNDGSDGFGIACQLFGLTLHAAERLGFDSANNRQFYALQKEWIRRFTEPQMKPEPAKTVRKTRRRSVMPSTVIG